MFFKQDRESLRGVYVEAWRKARERLPMQPVEALIADVVAEHPEYHRLLEQGGDTGNEYFPESGESNPFLHMGMHIAIREQVAAGRPAGIADVHRALAARAGGAHEAEHRMLECLGEALWRAQRDGTPPDEAAYLACLHRLTRRGAS